MYSPKCNQPTWQSADNSTDSPRYKGMESGNLRLSNASKHTVTKVAKFVYNPTPAVLKPRCDKYAQIPLSPSFTRSILNDTHAIHMKETVIPDQIVCVKPSEMVPQDPNSEENLAQDITNDLQLSFRKNKLELEKCAQDLQSYLNNNLRHSPNNVPETENISSKVLMPEKSSLNQVVDIPDLNLDFLENNSDPTKGQPSPVKQNIKIKKTTLNIPPPNKLIRKSIKPLSRKNPDKKPELSNRPSNKQISTRRNAEPATKPSAETDKTNTSKRSIDSAKARLYMLEQQKKRKLEENNSKTIQNKIAKEEIKKRLAALQKKSLKIVGNNLKNVRKNTTEETELVLAKKCDPVEVTVEPLVAPPATEFDQKTKPTVPDRGAIVFRKKSSEDQGLERNATNMGLIENEKEVIEQIILKSKTPSPKPVKRMGILRRAEYDPKATQLPLDSKTVLKKKLTTDTIKSTHKPQSPLKSKSPESPRIKTDIEKELELKVPESMASLKSTSLKSTKRKTISSEKINFMHTNDKRKRNVPYWLKPTPVQVYPYNFIMAVRKKLESITNPVVCDTNKISKCPPVRTDTNKIFKTPLARPKEPSRTLSSNFRHNLDKSDLEQSRSREMLETINSIPELSKPIEEMNNKKSFDYRQSISERIDERKSYSDDKFISSSSKKVSSNSDLNTNFSSITLQISDSNTTSDISSMKSEINRVIPMFTSTRISTQKSTNGSDTDSQDTISISSAIFSQSSPEKKRSQIDLPVPLSTDKIECLQVVSNSMRLNKPPLDEAVSDVLENKPLSDSNPQKADIDKSNILEMLETFNKSLSQVISVNQQLHNVLCNPPATGVSTGIAHKMTQVELTVTDKPKNIKHIVENNDIFKHSISGTDKTGSDEPIYSSKFNTSATISDKISEKHKISTEFPSNILDNQSVLVSTTNHSHSSNSSRRTNNIRSEQWTTSDISFQTKSDETPSNIPTNNQSNKSNSNEIEEQFSSTQHSASIKTNISEFIAREDGANSDHSITSIRNNSINTIEASPINEQSVSISNRLNDRVNDYFNSEYSITSLKSITVMESPIKDKSTAKSNRSEITTKELKSASEAKENDYNLNTSIGSDIYAVFNQTDMEFSVMSTNGNNTILSEGNLSYSSIGMYEQLIKTEARKSEHLTSLMKIREKSLVDRTKGQIAWLELQKQKFKEKGLTVQITAVKKKQRALLMRLEKERAYIHKTVKEQASSPSTRYSSKPKFNQLNSNINIRRTPQKFNVQQNQAFKGFEIAAGSGLEEMLQKREEELQRRRAHVEHLINWHQRLDNEEFEVLEMEKLLMTYTASRQKQNRNESSPAALDAIAEVAERSKSDDNDKNHKQIKEIEKSLKMLQNISSGSVNPDDHVHASGNKLNRLWRRLTGQSEQKFSPSERYKLCKADLEQIYEDAKVVVLMRFTSGSEILNILDQSTFNQSIQEKSDNQIIESDDCTKLNDEEDSLKSIPNIETEPVETSDTVTSVVSALKSPNVAVELVPLLNLNFSPEPQSHESRKSEMISDMSYDQGYYFSDHNQEEDIIDRRDENSIPSELPISENVIKDATESLEESLQNDPKINDISLYHQTQSISYTQNTSIDIVESIENSLSETSQDKSIINESNLFNLSDTTDQLIEDISFPNIELTINNETNKQSSATDIAQECDDKYLSDEFESSHDKTLSDQSKNNSTSNQTSLSVTSTGSQEPHISEQLQVSSLSSSNSDVKSKELEKRLIDIDESLKDINKTIAKAPVMELQIKSPDRMIASTSKTLQRLDESSPQTDENKENENEHNKEVGKIEPLIVRNKNINESFPLVEIMTKSDDSFLVKHASMIRDYVIPPEFKIPNKMPDIISEAEVLRRQQLQIEQEIKQLEQTVPFVFLREIPNKPPPPYVPPAHGSPMTTIFPSDDRIHEIVFRQMAELYEAHNRDPDNPTLNYDIKPSILDENITNIYERIILDICKECISELYLHAPSSSSAAKQSKYKYPLAFYNPPDRLRCIQEFVLKRVKKLLHNNNIQMVRVTAIAALACSRRKRDFVDEILVQEMMEDEAKWTNFDAEELEVLERITNEIMQATIDETLKDVASAYAMKKCT